MTHSLLFYFFLFISVNLIGKTIKNSWIFLTDMFVTEIHVFLPTEEEFLKISHYMPKFISFTLQIELQQVTFH